MIFSRRQLLKLPGGSPARGPGGCARRDTRQNVLFVVLNDLNDCIAVNLKGHPQMKTPNLDRLMARGVNFANAHCSAPVCAASRNSFLTGLHPTTTGWYSDGDYDDSAEQVLGDTPTLPQHFKATGYTTLASGKIFHTGVSDYRHAEQWNETLPYHEISNQDLLARGYGYGARGKKDHKYYPFPAGGGQVVQTFGPDTPGKSLCWGALDREDTTQWSHLRELLTMASYFENKNLLHVSNPTVSRLFHWDISAAAAADKRRIGLRHMWMRKGGYQNFRVWATGLRSDVSTERSDTIS